MTVSVCPSPTSKRKTGGGPERYWASVGTEGKEGNMGRTAAVGRIPDFLSPTRISWELCSTQDFNIRARKRVLARS